MKTSEIFFGRKHKMKHILLFVVCICLLLTGCGGGGSSSPNNPNNPKPGQPLDPQGNWFFTFNSTSNAGVHTVAGALFELNPPTVTGKNLTGISATQGCPNNWSIAGQASGINSITLTMLQTNKFGGQAPAQLKITGTIADDQKSMSGSYTTSPSGACFSDLTGNWTARLLPPVDGNWHGTLTAAARDELIITGTSLVENVDQTTPHMGQVTGTITVLSGSGKACFPNSVTFTIPPLTPTGSFFGSHVAVFLNLLPAPDTDGVAIQNINAVVDNDATSINTSQLGPGFQVVGGVCDGLIFNGTLTR